MRVVLFGATSHSILSYSWSLLTQTTRQLASKKASNSGYDYNGREHQNHQLRYSEKVFPANWTLPALGKIFPANWILIVPGRATWYVHKKIVYFCYWICLLVESISRSYPLNCSSFCHICLEPRHDL
eukprot:sb/3475434/